MILNGARLRDWMGGVRARSGRLSASIDRRYCACWTSLLLSSVPEGDQVEHRRVAGRRRQIVRHPPTAGTGPAWLRNLGAPDSVPLRYVASERRTLLCYGPGISHVA